MESFEDTPLINLWEFWTQIHLGQFCCDQQNELLIMSARTIFSFWIIMFLHYPHSTDCCLAPRPYLQPSFKFLTSQITLEDPLSSISSVQFHLFCQDFSPFQLLQAARSILKLLIFSFFFFFVFFPEFIFNFKI